VGFSSLGIIAMRIMGGGKLDKGRELNVAPSGFRFENFGDGKSLVDDQFFYSFCLLHCLVPFLR